MEAVHTDIETEELVPLNEPDRAWIRETIQNAHKAHGLGRLTRFIREWGGFGAAVAIVLFVALQYTTYVEFRTKTGDRLDAIESSLRTLNASQAPAKVLKELASLDVKHLTQNLPALRKVSEQPVAEISPAPNTLREVANTLHQVNVNTEDYWPTVLRFIQFASAGLATNAPPSRPIEQASKFSNVSGFGTISGQVIVLSGRIESIRFINDRIVFTDDPVFFRNVQFINCAFEFPDLAAPSPSLQRTGQVLLASGLTSGYISGM